MRVSAKTLQSGDLRVFVRNGPAWLAPLLRGSILLDVPVLAPETYTQHWGQTTVMPEFFWKRIEKLVLLGSHGSLHIRASNLLHSCTMESDHNTAITFEKLTDFDEFRDPVLPAVANTIYKISVLMDGESIRCIEAAEDPGGGWMLTRCSPSSLVLCASNAQRDADTRRWSGEMRGSLTPLTTLTRLVWRFVEPSFPGDALRWKPVVPQPTMWEVRWKGVMLSFRRVAFGECDAIENAMFEALDALSTTNPTVTVSATPAGGLQITPCDSAPPDATVRYESSLYRQKKADSANRDKDLVFLVVPLASASCDSPALSRVKTALVKFHFAGQSLVVSPYDKRTDSIRFDADSIHAVPETIKPAEDSDASWKSICILHMKRGESLRADISCRLAVGAVHSKHASACGGVSAVLEDDGSMELIVETMGHRSSVNLTIAAVEAAISAIKGMVASVQNSHPGAVPSPHLPIKRPSVRNEVKAGAPEWKCMACGARTKLSTCKCKKSVMEKMPNPMAKLVLG